MERNVFANISPLDHRYSLRKENFADYGTYFSEKAVVEFQARVEVALIKALHSRGVCDKQVVEEVQQAAENIEVEEVYEEEKKTKHNIRALVNCLQKRVSPSSRPYIHLSATSYDIVDTANALRYKEGTFNLILPRMRSLLQEWLDIAEQQKETLQIGRTHGQHAEPLTFGLVMAFYCSRLKERMDFIKKAARNLRGKMSGAVGAYNASSIFFEDPGEFEREFLQQLGLKPGPVSTQIVAPEYMTDFMHGLTSAFGVLADFSDDMRHLQRTEIREVGEYFESDQVGSSTMPHKRNPINYENVKSMYKEFTPRMVTSYLDQLSEHQRDLSNSASGRFIPETVVGLLLCVDRLQRVSSRMHIDAEQMKKNFDQTRELVIAEPLYIFLASQGHPDAHEKVRKLTLEAEKKDVSLKEIVQKDEELTPYLEKLTDRQKKMMYNPELYTGKAATKTEKIIAEIRKSLS